MPVNLVVHADGAERGDDKERPDGADEERSETPWDEADFSPLPSPGDGEFVVDGGRVFRVNKDGHRKPVCDFVPELLEERIVEHDVDRPGRDLSQELKLRISAPSGEESIVDIELVKGRSPVQVIIDSLPSGVARLGVASPRDLSQVVARLASPTLVSSRRYGQTGWLPDDGVFLFPGGQGVTLDRLSSASGAPLLGCHGAPDASALAVGLDVLAAVCESAPPSVTLPILASILAGPIFRRADHLDARAFGVLLAGASQLGKTTLVSRLYCLLGEFWRKPMCIATWRSTLPTIEAVLHHLRDLTVFIDNFRASDGDARDVFRQTVIALGDSAARDRSMYTRDGIRIARGLHPNALLLATGEHGFDDDAAVNGRLIEVLAHDIDVRRVLQFEPDQLRSLPQVFSGFVRYVGAFKQGEWEVFRDHLQNAAATLAASAPARTSEHLATLAVTIQLFVEFACRQSPAADAKWRQLSGHFIRELPEMARAQARRVHDEQVDQILLSEVARAVRQGKARLEPLGTPVLARATHGDLLGAFDADDLHLIPDVVTRWLNRQLVGRHGRIGRRELGAVLRQHGSAAGPLPQRTFGGGRHGVWSVRRELLGTEWDGLLDAVPARVTSKA